MTVGFCPQKPPNMAPWPPGSAPPPQAHAHGPGRQADLLEISSSGPWLGSLIYRSLSFLVCEMGMKTAPVTWDCLFGISNK